MSKLTELITLYIDEFLNEYKVNINKKTILSLVNKSLNKLDEKNQEALIKNSEALRNLIKKIIINYLSSILKKDDLAFNLVNDYVKKFISQSSDYLTALKELLKLSKFLNKLDFTPNPDIIVRLLEENAILSANVKIVVEKLLSLIKKGHLDEAIDDNFLVTLIEVYCMLNDIEISFTEEISEEETSYLDSFKEYLKEIAEYPILSPEEERELAIKVYNGDESAKEKLINHNLRLVISIAKRYASDKKFDLLDIIQNGNLGLIRAIEKYDYRKSFRLSTYATPWIKQSIVINIIKTGRTIKISANKNAELRRLQSVREELEKTTGHEPSIDELAKKLDTNREAIEELIMLELDAYSLNTPLREIVGNEGDKKRELQDMIEDSTISIEEASIKRNLSDELQHLFEQANLTPREIMVLTFLYGLYDGVEYTLEYIGDIYNISKEMVRQIKVTAIRKLRRIKAIDSFCIYTDNPEKSLEFLRTYRKMYYSFLKPKKFYDQEALDELISSNPSAKKFLEATKNTPTKTKYTRKKVKEILSQNLPT